jgi:ribosomal protein L37AE/L43A
MPKPTPRPSAAPPAKFRLAFIDIETAPLLIYAWKTYDTNALSIFRDSYILSFAVKWYGEKTVKTYALPDFPGYAKNPENDLEITKKLREVLDEADAVCAHNGISFDVPRITAKIYQHKLPPPSPFKQIDTLRIARKEFSFTKNNLDHLCQLSGIGKKVKTGGFDLWLGCIAKDPKAWKKMVAYNKYDVVLLAELYERLRPWASNHPNINLKAPKDHQCPACGSTDVIRRGWNSLISYRSERWQCKNCSKWSSGKREKIQAKLLKA